MEVERAVDRVVKNIKTTSIYRPTVFSHSVITSRAQPMTVLLIIHIIATCGMSVALDALILFRLKVWWSTKKILIFEILHANM